MDRSTPVENSAGFFILHYLRHVVNNWEGKTNPGLQSKTQSVGHIKKLLTPRAPHYLRTGGIDRETRPANLRKSCNIISKQDPQCQSFAIDPTEHLRSSQATGRRTATIENVVVGIRGPQSRGRTANTRWNPDPNSNNTGRNPPRHFGWDPGRGTNTSIEGPPNQPLTT